MSSIFTERNDTSVPLILDEATRRRRVCVLSEDLSGSLDEGIKKFAVALAESLRQQHDVTLVATEGSSIHQGAQLARAPRTFLSWQLYTELTRCAPEVLLYVARSSTTFASFVRCRVLKTYCSDALVVLIGLQARRHRPIQRRLLRYLAPDFVYVQSSSSKQYLDRLGCPSELLPSGVDTDTFQPVSSARRRELRASYGLRVDLPVVLHVGHLQRGRGIQTLADLALRGGCQVVLVTSSSTTQESGLGEELRRAGVMVLTDYQPHIEHFYQLADCYVFPVQSTDNSIEVPLSVLEAFACDLPVVTTRFGGLPRLFGEQECPALVFVDSASALADEAVRLCETGLRGTRSLALPYSWNAIAMNLLDRVLSREVTRG